MGIIHEQNGDVGGVQVNFGYIQKCHRDSGHLQYKTIVIYLSTFNKLFKKLVWC